MRWFCFRFGLKIVIFVAKFKIVDREFPTLVAFVTKHCDYCETLRVELDAASLLLRKERSTARLATIDCTHQATISLCERHHVKTFPSLLWFERGAFKSKFVGKRTRGELVEFVRAKELAVRVARHRDEL